MDFSEFFQTSKVHHYHCLQSHQISRNSVERFSVASQNRFWTRTPPGGILGENSKIHKLGAVRPHPVNMCTKFQEDPTQTVGGDAFSVGRRKSNGAKRSPRCRRPSWIFRNFFKRQKFTTITVYNPTKFHGIPSSNFPSRAKTSFGLERHLVAF